MRKIINKTLKPLLNVLFLFLVYLIIISFIKIYYFDLKYKNYSKNKAFIDLIFIYETVKKNHPGCGDINFIEKFEKDINLICNIIIDYKNKNIDIGLIKNFFNEFKDPHFKVEFYYSDEFYLINYLKNFFYKLFEKKEYKKFELKEISNKKYYLKIETFCPNEEEEIQLEEIAKKLEILSNQQDSILIIDLRNNGGGDTRYCNQILGAIFGKHYFYQKLYQNQKNEFARYRVSKDNVKHFIDIWRKINIVFDDFVIKDQIEKLSLAYENGYEYCDIYDWNEDLLKYSKNKYYCEKIETDAKIKIKVLINRFVGSAALDFLDYLYYMNYENIVLIGEQTNFDSIYMDCRSVELPSGNGKLTFPQKKMINRKRRSEERYFPDIEMNDADIKNFILMS